MKETLINVGTFIRDAYLKPAPKIAIKAVLTSWIGTTIGLAIGAIIVYFKKTEN